MSHDAWVGMWVAGFPEVVMPLWQVAQLPGATLAWLNFAPTNDWLLWQLSQAWVVVMWRIGITMLAPARRAPLTWQLAQSRGVPLNTPRTWQDSQATDV